MDEKKINKARQRRSEIEEILAGDENGLRLLKSLTFSAFDYVDTTVNFEAYRRKLNDCERFIDDSTETMINLDRDKRNAHEAVISKLNSFNRYLFNNYGDKAPIGGIYSLEPPESIRDRHCVGDWIGYYVFGIKHSGGISFK